MSVTPNLTSTEITNLQSNSYDWANNEKPVPSAKLNGGVEVMKDIVGFLQADSPQLIQETKNVASLAGSWVNSGGAFPPVTYWKDSSGVVHLEGVANGGSSTIFTLPSGYRPSHYLPYPGNSAGTFCDLAVETDGRVRLISGSNAGVCLNNIHFRAI